MDCKQKSNTLTFDEMVKGWTSFHSFSPEFMVGMNNKFFSFENGELYEHHSGEVPRNTYYGVKSPSKISIMVNDHPSDIKELQAISLEGNTTWDTLIRAYISNSDDYLESSVKAVEFVKKEGIWYAYARRNESTESYDSKSTYGLGIVGDVLLDHFTLQGGNSSLCIGDRLVRGSDLRDMGKIIGVQGALVTLDQNSTLQNGDFVLGMKDARIEGGNLRGYTLRMDLTTDAIGQVELFAVNAEIMKSFS